MNTDFSKDISFSIVIPTCNRSGPLKAAIKALCEQDNPSCNYEIIVVDNGSNGNTKDVVKALAGESKVPIRYIFEAKKGSHFARNAGFIAAKGAVLGLIDDDIIVGSGWVENIFRAYDNPRVDCAGGKIKIRWINGQEPEWIAPFKHFLGELDWGSESKELQYPKMINAGNFSIRKRILLKVGGYNPCNAPGDKLIGSGESELCMKIYRLGGHIFWIPKAEAWHVQDVQKITFPLMCYRSKLGGMGRAYSFYRAANGNFSKIFKKIRTNFPSLIKYCWRAFLHAGKRDGVFYESSAGYHNSLGFICYLVRIKIDSRLHKLVKQDDWLNA